jgi:hypothetical protein
MSHGRRSVSRGCARVRALGVQPLVCPGDFFCFFRDRRPCRLVRVQVIVSLSNLSTLSKYHNRDRNRNRNRNRNRDRNRNCNRNRNRNRNRGQPLVGSCVFR